MHGATLQSNYIYQKGRRSTPDFNHSLHSASYIQYQIISNFWRRIFWKKMPTKSCKTLYIWISLSSQHNLISWLFCSPFYKWGDWDAATLINWVRVTQLADDRARISAQVSLTIPCPSTKACSCPYGILGICWMLPKNSWDILIKLPLKNVHNEGVLKNLVEMSHALIKQEC